MERLTERTKYGIVGNNNGVENFPLYSLYDETHLDHGLIEQCFNKLAEYEDLEEQGLLLRLPCRVGDVLWCTDNKKTESFIVKEFKICAYKINRVEIYFENASGFGLCLFDGTLDEGWFLTKEEAEQALARMEGKNE